MAIQFQCPGCGQPIEVDSECAGQAVGCPYCHKTVTAPTSSTLAGTGAAPMAKPTGPAYGRFPGDGAAFVKPERDPSAGRVVSIVALVFSILTLVLTVTGAMLIRSHADEFNSFLLGLQELSQNSTNMSQIEMQRRSQEMASKLPPAVLLSFACCGLDALSFLTGLVLAIVAVGRSRRRGMAYVCFGALFLCLCLFCWQTTMISNALQKGNGPNQSTTASIP